MKARDSGCEGDSGKDGDVNFASTILTTTLTTKGTDTGAKCTL